LVDLLFPIFPHADFDRPHSTGLNSSTRLTTMRAHMLFKREGRADICLLDCFICCADDITQRCGGYFRMSIYQRNGVRYSPRPQQSQCTYNGVARAPVTRVVTTDSTGALTQYQSTGPTNYGPVTTGTTIIPITNTNSNGETSVYESTIPVCDGNCSPNQHTPGGSVTTTHMPTYTQVLETPAVVSGCNFQGCYDDVVDKALNPRVLADERDFMTIELCVGECLRLGYLYAGLEYGSECYCGPSIEGNHQLVYGNTSSQDIILTCSNPEFACRGNRAEMCGGFAAIGIYYCPANLPATTT